MGGTSGKVIFANQLRGLAVVMVLLAHWCGVYWYSRDVVSSYIHAPAETISAPSWISYIAPPTVNYGTLGVAIFFLISGFVIPFSLNRSNGLSFLLARALRIYPVYISGALIMLFGTWASSKYWNVDYSINPFQIATNLLLLNNDFLQPTIDLVNWTLSVEIKFYLTCAALIFFIRNGNTTAITLTSIIFFGYCEWLPASLDSIVILGDKHLSLSNLKWQLILIVYMFIGTMFYYYHNEKINLKQLIASISGLTILFITGLSHTSFWGAVTIYNFAYGLVIFSIAFTLRRFAKPNPILDWMAKISFPIYATHSILGYTIIRMMTSHGISATISLFATLPLILALAYGIHIAIENPSIALGKKLGGAVGAKGQQAMEPTTSTHP